MQTLRRPKVRDQATEQIKQYIVAEKLFAHTSPIYFDMQGRRRFDAKVAGDLIAEMEDSVKTISQKGKFANAVERQSVFTVYDAGIATLKKWISAGKSTIESSHGQRGH